MGVLLDTDILSAIMRREPQATAHAHSYLREHSRFMFSVITRYEILRGLRTKRADRPVRTFEALCAASTILPLTDAIADRASDLYADLHKRGVLIGDAAILIAATALVHNLAVATNNEAHFRRIDALLIQNWRS